MLCPSGFGRPDMVILARFVNDKTGSAAVEYGLIAAGIFIAIIAVLIQLIPKLSTTVTAVL
jgi:Flp pilus assembly pilin Flp